MTSEIRANTIKNRVGLGTVSYTNTGIVVSGIVTANSFSGPYNGTDIVGTGITLTSTDAGSSAGPELKLFRNSASPADADYLGQIKFAGESDTGVERNYAKITGKILDASNGTEDGIIEFAHIKNGSQVITGRWRSDSLQLLNGTNFSVAGTSEFTGNITANGNVDLTDSGRLKLGTGDDLQIYHSGSGNFVDVHTNHLQFRTAGTTELMAEFKLNNAVDLYYDGTKRFETKNNGAQVNGTTLFIRGGSGEDSILQFIANNSASYNDHYNFRVAATGAFSLQTEVSANNYENLLTATQNGAVELYHNNIVRLETTSSGVKVSGSFPDLIIHDTSTTNDNFRILHNSGGTQLQVDPNNVSSGSYLLAAIDGSEKLRIDSGGRLQIGASNNTGSNTKFVVGFGNNINTTAIINTGDVDTNALTLSNWDGSTTTNKVMIAFDNSGNGGFDIGMPAGSGDFAFQSSSGEKVRIEAGGNVGIGTNNPVRPLHIHAADCRIRLEDAGIATDVELQNSSGDAVLTTNGASNVRLQTNNTERLRITSGGNFSIGNTSAAKKIHISTTGNQKILIDPNYNNNSGGSSNGEADANNVVDSVLIRTSFGSNAASQSNAGHKWGIKFQGYNGNDFTQNTAKIAAVYAVSEDEATGYNVNVGLAFHTSPYNTAHREVMRINTNGIVTKPYQYVFTVSTTNHQKTANWSKITNMTPVAAQCTGVSDGTNWSNSTQRFTAPVAGVYHFFVGGWSYGNSNGARYAYAFRHTNNNGFQFIGGGDYCSGDSPMAGWSRTIKLAKDEWVELWGYSAISVRWGGGHEFFWGGYLLG